ncbi:MAG: rhodanese-like domain-containing protein [Lachnospiraceae bacterium]|nr:rhodanese-like domain-containing protein [Lachnospiraceae bacterium]
MGLFKKNLNKLIEENRDALIVDVRTFDEYKMGHIPQAMNLPNETINNVPPVGLKDKGHKIIVYCRSGMRAKDAAAKLKMMGYTNIINGGGINSWKGGLEK